MKKPTACRLHLLVLGAFALMMVAYMITINVVPHGPGRMGYCWDYRSDWGWSATYDPDTLIQWAVNHGVYQYIPSISATRVMGKPCSCVTLVSADSTAHASGSIDGVASRDMDDDDLTLGKPRRNPPEHYWKNSLGKQDEDLLRCGVVLSPKNLIERWYHNDLVRRANVKEKRARASAKAKATIERRTKERKKLCDDCRVNKAIAIYDGHMRLCDSCKPGKGSAHPPGYYLVKVIGSQEPASGIYLS